MTVEEIIGLGLALAIMLIGLVGSIVPGLPGAPLVLAAAIAHRLYFGSAHSINNLVLIALAVCTLLSLALDYLATMYGAKRFGATWRGIVGAVIGGTVGLFFNIPGILLGPFIGAMMLEIVGGYEFRKAARAGFGATLGLLAGAVGKAALCVGMIGVFTAGVIF